LDSNPSHPQLKGEKKKKQINLMTLIFGQKSFDAFISHNLPNLKEQTTFMLEEQRTKCVTVVKLDNGPIQPLARFFQWKKIRFQKHYT